MSKGFTRPAVLAIVLATYSLTSARAQAGRYDLDLTFTPERQIPAGAGATTPTGDSNGPSIYTALREQLGLKLEAQKDLEEVLVIDHVERPSGN
jgi:uncharacterized protein (TIGR03435 family)